MYSPFAEEYKSFSVAFCIKGCNCDAWKNTCVTLSRPFNFSGPRPSFVKWESRSQERFLFEYYLDAPYALWALWISNDVFLRDSGVTGIALTHEGPCLEPGAHGSFVNVGSMKFKQEEKSHSCLNQSIQSIAWALLLCFTLMKYGGRCIRLSPQRACRNKPSGHEIVDKTVYN